MVPLEFLFKSGNPRPVTEPLALSSVGSYPFFCSFSFSSCWQAHNRSPLATALAFSR